MGALFDKRSCLAVLGCLLKDPTLIDDLDRPLSRYDFKNEDKFYELLYVAIYNLHMQGVNTIDEFAIDSYLSNYKEQYTMFQENKGLDYIGSAKEMVDLGNYDYNYHRFRKFSLLRFYEEKGLDIKFIYNYTESDPTKQGIEEHKFDEYKESDIVELVESTFVIKPNMEYCTSNITDECSAGDGLDELIDEYMEIPDVGVPLNSMAINTLARGARKGCLYMRSLPSGFGKTRLAAGDACKISVPYYYDIDNSKWVYTGNREPVLYITTEMSNKEIQSIFCAIVSGVNADHIKYGEYEPGELERVRQANQYIKESPLMLCHIPDFSIEDIKNIVKKYHREYGVNYFFFDYIFTSLRLMNEISTKSGMAGLKEHQLLLVFATELKSLCQQLNVFMFTASQLNGEAQNAPIKDQNLLAGSKALANKLDVGMVAMSPNKSELKKLEPILHNQIGSVIPNFCTWIYKIRSGRITRVIVWSKIDMGTMRVRDLFVTNHNFELIDIDFTKIEMVEKTIKDNSVAIADVPDQPIVEEKTEDVVEKKNFDW